MDSSGSTGWKARLEPVELEALMTGVVATFPGCYVISCQLLVRSRSTGSSRCGRNIAMMRSISALLLAWLLNSAPADLAQKPEPVSAAIETTLATAKGQIRQFAFDGDPGTFFASEQNPSGTDHFTLVFDKPVNVKSISVITGRTDGSDSLDEGKLAVSADGKSFRELAPFAQGKSQATLADESIVAESEFSPPRSRIITSTIRELSGRTRILRWPFSSTRSSS